MALALPLERVLAAGRVAKVALSLGLDRLRPTGRVALPFDASQLSAEWLSHVLSIRSPGVRVRSFKFVESHAGTTARARLALDYEDVGSGPALPERLFLKIAPAAIGQRLFVTLFELGSNETNFYQTTAGQLAIRTPEVFAAECGPGGRRFALLLEDLDPDKVRFATVGDRVDLQTAERVIDELAKLHASFWETPRFGSDLAWLPSLESRRKDLPLNRLVTEAMIGRAVKRYADEFPPEFRKIGRLCVERRSQLEALWARGSQTLVHGDCHLGNLFFEGDGVGFLDWQVCARLPGIRDVSYFITNSCPSKLRGEHERALIDRYLEALRESDVLAPSAEEAWRDHRIHVAYTWLSSAVTAAAGEGFQAREIALAALNRSTRAVVELDTVGAIEAELC